MAENINISPDMINNLVDMLKNSSSSKSQSSTSKSPSGESNSDGIDSRGIFSDFKSSVNSSENKNFDIETIMKIKSIMDTLNKKDDPKSNLLYSLKPYLRKSKQEKLDQYVNILKISEVANLFNKNQGGSK